MHNDTSRAKRLTAMGYRRVSWRHCLLARIDRANWLDVLSAHLNRPKADFYVMEHSGTEDGGYVMGKEPAGQWCDYYRRCLSEDTVHVSYAVCKLCLTSGHDPVGFVPVTQAMRDELAAIRDTPRMFIAYDGRAEVTDPSDCVILETIGEKFTERDYSTWEGHDAVLVAYDIRETEAGSELINEQIIGHWREGYAELYRRSPK